MEFVEIDEESKQWLTDLSKYHNPNDESHKGRSGSCFYCIMLEGLDKGNRK